MNLLKQAFLLGHDLIGSQLRECYSEYLGLNNQSKGDLDALHNARLQLLLREASFNVPFYRSRAPGLTLEEFPILTKTDVHDHFEDLIHSDLYGEWKNTSKKRKYSWTEVKTGGSTGQPTRVIHDKTMRDWGRAGRLYSQFLCGFPIGTPFYLLWGAMSDIDSSKDNALRRVMHSLLRSQTLNAFLMDEARSFSYLEIMRNGAANHLMAYIDAAYDLARFAKENNIETRPLKSVMACAGTVTDAHRALLHEVFGARLHNKYGSRECADMACECSSGGLHVYWNSVHLEIVDDQNRPTQPGQLGRILVTLLHNKSFPLIRYEIGDIGAWREDTCSCGSPLPLLDRIEGRTTEIIRGTKGQFVSPVAIRHLIGVVHDNGKIKRFQFQQTSVTSYCVLLECGRPMMDKEFLIFSSRLTHDLKQILGEDAEIAFSQVDLIPETTKGKFLYVRNLLHSHNGPVQN